MQPFLCMVIQTHDVYFGAEQYYCYTKVLLSNLCTVLNLQFSIRYKLVEGD